MKKRNAFFLFFIFVNVVLMINCSDSRYLNSQFLHSNQSEKSTPLMNLKAFIEDSPNPEYLLNLNLKIWDAEDNLISSSNGIALTCTPASATCTADLPNLQVGATYKFEASNTLIKTNKIEKTAQPVIDIAWNVLLVIDNQGIPSDILDVTANGNQIESTLSLSTDELILESSNDKCKFLIPNSDTGNNTYDLKASPVLVDNSVNKTKTAKVQFECTGTLEKVRVDLTNVSRNGQFTFAYIYINTGFDNKTYDISSSINASFQKSPETSKEYFHQLVRRFDAESKISGTDVFLEIAVKAISDKPIDDSEFKLSAVDNSGKRFYFEAPEDAQHPESNQINSMTKYFQTKVNSNLLPLDITAVVKNTPDNPGEVPASTTIKNTIDIVDLGLPSNPFNFNVFYDTFDPTKTYKLRTGYREDTTTTSPTTLISNLFFNSQSHTIPFANDYEFLANLIYFDLYEKSSGTIGVFSIELYGINELDGSDVLLASRMLRISQFFDITSSNNNLTIVSKSDGQSINAFNVSLTNTTTQSRTTSTSTTDTTTR